MTSPDHSQITTEAENFIPFLYDDLVEMCLADREIPVTDHALFREFCSFVSTYTCFRSNQSLQAIEKDYSIFNPDAELKQYKAPDDTDHAAALQRILSTFSKLAADANYRKLTHAEMQQAFAESALIKLKTAVDLDEYSHVECYVRGNDSSTVVRRDWRLKTLQEPIAIWRRVLLLMQFKDESELSEQQRKRRKKNPLQSQAGKIYLYQYKDVPHRDLEILFPNVRVSMNRLDRLLLGVPGLIATVATIAKVGVKLALVAGVIMYVIFNKPMFGVDETTMQDMMQITVTVMGVVMAFGTLGFKQYNSVKNKRIGFLKKVSEQLFFRNIAMNKSAIDRVVKDSEKENCKETLLVYYHLLVNKNAVLTRPELDELIESWMFTQHGTTIDFDIDDAVDRLKNFGDSNSTALLSESEDGKLSVLPLPEAAILLDYWWDNAFNFSQTVAAKQAA